eukprot:TRINITY_DN54667_c0_g1_i1.p1 TRINITY_DN54667_c0_g1~~TRINITY_DN54667_c0_g1_i1.p1  ORF type:complete len:884 (-),score=108.44 TRINITY_DN54667_c0_g1_i1:2239-4890(-)
MEDLKAIQGKLWHTLSEVASYFGEIQTAFNRVVEEAQFVQKTTDQEVAARTQWAQMKIDKGFRELHEAQRQYEDRLNKARQQVKTGQDHIKLNVGGTQFVTSKSTLLAENDTFFHAMLHSGSWAPDLGDAYFIDRNPKWFGTILDYLRDNEIKSLIVERMQPEEHQELVAEVEFYQVRGLLEKLAVVSTLGGKDGGGGYCGDGGLVVEASFNWPCGACCTTTHLYVADSWNHVVRAIHLHSGVITTVVGCGEEGHEGDGGAAELAKMKCPNALTIKNDKLYIADFASHAVRVVDLNSGIINTFAGTGTGGDSGDGSAATAASLNSPQGVSATETHLYIADTGNHRVRAVEFATGKIETVAGNGEAGFSGDGGPATEAQLCGPQDIAVYASSVLIADAGNARVRVLNKRTGCIATFVGNGEEGSAGDSGPAHLAQLSHPCALMINTGKLFVCDLEANCVRVVTLATGIIDTFCGTGVGGFGGDGGSPKSAQLYRPTGITVSPDGNRYFITDMKNHRIRVIGGYKNYLPSACNSPIPSEADGTQPTPTSTTRQRTQQGDTTVDTMAQVAESLRKEQRRQHVHENKEMEKEESPPTPRRCLDLEEMKEEATLTLTRDSPKSVERITGPDEDEVDDLTLTPSEEEPTNTSSLDSPRCGEDEPPSPPPEHEANLTFSAMPLLSTPRSNSSRSSSPGGPPPRIPHLPLDLPPPPLTKMMMMNMQMEHSQHQQQPHNVHYPPLYHTTFSPVDTFQPQTVHNTRNQFRQPPSFPWNSHHPQAGYRHPHARGGYDGGPPPPPYPANDEVATGGDRAASSPKLLYTLPQPKQPDRLRRRTPSITPCHTPLPPSSPVTPTRLTPTPASPSPASPPQQSSLGTSPTASRSTFSKP